MFDLKINEQRDIEVFADHMPRGMQEIAAVIGVEAAMKLAHYLGGCDYYIPKGGQDCPRGMYLKEILGVAAADKLMQIYGGANCYIYMCREAFRAVKVRHFLRHLAELMAQGESQKLAIQKIGYHYGINERLANELLRQQRNGQITL
ncbi:MAG: hypothetical protein Q4B71_00450 [Cardiobacteriaceae bacterium]|nr:hypothetical protein [Cardiobacteriaceae bacterium]